jgi:hypothetical protein
MKRGKKISMAAKHPRFEIRVKICGFNLGRIEGVDPIPSPGRFERVFSLGGHRI